MKRGTEISLVALLAVGLFSITAFGVEKKTETQPPKITTQAVAETYELVNLNKRDPFTIWEEKVVKPPTPIGGDWQPPTPTKNTTPIPGVNEVDVRKINEMVQDAYNLFYVGNYDDSIKVCQKTLNILETASAGTLAQERCMRLLKAAQKLKSRKEVEDEFKKLPILIKGIVWRPKSSFAVINDKVMKAGEIVGESGARVYEIYPDEVVFVYKGLKVSKMLFEGGDKDGNKGRAGKPAKNR